MPFSSSSCHPSPAPRPLPIHGHARMIIDDWGESERGVRVEEESVSHRFNEGSANTREERLLEVYRGLTELQNRTSGFLILINVPNKVIICTFLVT